MVLLGLPRFLSPGHMTEGLKMRVLVAPAYQDPQFHLDIMVIPTAGGSSETGHLYIRLPARGGTLLVHASTQHQKPKTQSARSSVSSDGLISPGEKL